MSAQPRTDYIRVTGPHSHVRRSRQILAAHPEVRDLAGPAPTSAAWVTALVALQLAIALLVGDSRWWVWLPAAYVVGATIDHALWVLIHECSHNLVFGRPAWNKLMAMLANVPLVFPAALSFAKYHLLHHSHLGELDFDGDVPGPTESRVVKSPAAKAVWLASFSAVQGLLRTHRLKKVRFLDGWIVANAITQMSAVLALWAVGGAGPLKYLVASSVAAIGFHPLGARWIQEHFVFAEGQETYSYYGPLNRVCFNMGYHNEHHDLVTIPWSRLPALKAMAPEFYDHLYAHRSWTRLLFRFVLDPTCTLFDRVVRPSR
jgi:sphingolipid delta-4 desaturase